MLPKLELPPPDKTPSWEVGPRVRRGDVALAAIYNEVYCVVHSRHGPEYHLEGNVKLFRLTKTTMIHSHTLMLQHSSPRTSYQPHCTAFSFSVTDNLLLVHCKRDMCTAVFDIAAAGQDGDTDEPLANGKGGGDGRGESASRTQSNVSAGLVALDNYYGAGVDLSQRNKKSRAIALFPLAPPAPVAGEGEDILDGTTEGDYYSNAPESVLVSHEQHLDQALRPGLALTAEDIYLYKDGSE